MHPSPNSNNTPQSHSEGEGRRPQGAGGSSHRDDSRPAFPQPTQHFSKQHRRFFQAAPRHTPHPQPHAAASRFPARSRKGAKQIKPTLRSGSSPRGELSTLHRGAPASPGWPHPALNATLYFIFLLSFTSFGTPADIPAAHLPRWDAVIGRSSAFSHPPPRCLLRGELLTAAGRHPRTSHHQGDFPGGRIHESLHQAGLASTEPQRTPLFIEAQRSFRADAGT